MADVTVAQQSGDTKRCSVVRGVVSMPRVGTWHADLTANGPTSLTGKVTLTMGRALTLKGAVVRSRLHEGVIRLRVVGGAGGLQVTAKPKHYTSPTVRNVLADLLKDGGEAISATADAATLRKTLLAWTTLGVSVGAMVAGLMEMAGDVAWRVLPDGTVWTGPETWPEADVSYREIERDPENNLILIGQDTPSLLPGTSLDGQRVDYVEHQIVPGELRAKVWTTS